MNELVGGLGYAVKNWWMSLLLGLLYIAVALCLLFAPVSSYVALSVIFSISILVSGILEVFFAAGNKKTISSWGWYLAGGIIDLLIGIYLVFYPLVSMELIPFIVAFWLMFRGFTLCGYSTDLKRYGTKDWGGIWCLAFWLFFALWLSSGNLDLVLLPCSICCPSLSLLSDVSVSFSPSS